MAFEPWLATTNPGSNCAPRGPVAQGTAPSHRPGGLAWGAAFAFAGCALAIAVKRGSGSRPDRGGDRPAVCGHRFSSRVGGVLRLRRDDVCFFRGQRERATRAGQQEDEWPRPRHAKHSL